MLTKRRSAAAAGIGIWISVLKTTFFERVNVIDFRAENKFDAFRINKNFQITLFNHCIVIIRIFLKAHVIGQSRTATRNNTDA